MGSIFEDRENVPILDAAATYFNTNVLPAFENEFKSHENNADILFHSIKAGKRLRPFYCYLSYKLAGGSDDQAAHFAASAMELIHCSSLLIDDELDAKEERPDRKVETVRTIYSPQESVFMGACLELLYTYNLLVKASNCLDNGRRESLLRTFTESYSEGVTKEIEKWKHIEKKRIISKDEYWNKHIHSSGGLFFRMSGRVGALLASGDDAKVNRLSEIGYALGQILQAGDDVKDLKADMLQGYYSLSVIDFIDTLTSEEKTAMVNKLAGTLDHEDVDEIYAKMVDAGSINRTLEEMKKRGDRVKELLEEFPECEFRNHARELSDFLSCRMRLG